jgi:type IV secretory pathway VirJ component
MNRFLSLLPLCLLPCLGAPMAAAAPARPQPQAAQASKAEARSEAKPVPEPQSQQETQPDERVSWGRLGEIAVYKPTRPIRSVVLFFSGDGGWSKEVRSMADHLRRDGALVAGIDLPYYVKKIEGSDKGCAYPSGELEDFAHFFEARYGLAEYRYPILVGFESGASMVYALLAQAPAGTFAGGLSLGFCPELSIAHAFCEGDRLKTVAKAKQKGWELVPATALRDPWVAVQGEDDQACGTEATRKFVASVQNAKLVTLPDVGHGYALEKNWMTQFMDAYCDLSAGAPQNTRPKAPQDLAGLPLVEVKAQAGKSDLMALLITGDGGWAGLDQDVAKALSERGVPVVGLNSLKYFWQARTPEQTAQDVDRMLRYYLEHWDKQRVVLLGYSQGADVLPFVLNRLTPEVKARVAGAAVIGMADKAVFEFHFANWVHESDDGVPTRPEVEKLTGIKLTCIYGAEESESVCPGLDQAKVDRIKLPGAHHFNGDYERVAKAVLGAVGGG